MSWDEGASDLPKDPWPYGATSVAAVSDAHRIALKAGSDEMRRIYEAALAAALNEPRNPVQAHEALPPRDYLGVDQAGKEAQDAYLRDTSAGMTDGKPFDPKSFDK